MRIRVGGGGGGGGGGGRSERWTRLTFSILFVVSFLLFTQGCEGQLRLGKAVNLFIRYGYLSISMKVISHNDSETWLFKEPTKNIFKVSHIYPANGSSSPYIHYTKYL